MSQDIVADALNQIMNLKRVGKKEVEIGKISKLLVNLLELMKKKGHIDYEIKEGKAKVTIIDLNECKAIKPRFYVQSPEIDRYLRRFLPSRNFGTLIISTSKGLLNQFEAEENKIGGSLIAYFY